MPRLRSIHSRAALFVATATLAIVVAACSDDGGVSTGPSDVTGRGSDRIKLEAVVTSRAGSCPSIRFRLGGISVETNATTDFGLLCDRVLDGTPVEVDGTAMTSGVLIARELGTDSGGLGEPKFEAEGSILSVSPAGDCASSTGRRVNVRGLTFLVGIYTHVKDVTNGCAGLSVGNQVKAKGPLVNPPAGPLVPPRAAEVDGEN
jgi:hypothetical protein